MTEPKLPETTSKSTKQWLILGAKWCIFLLVVYGLWDAGREAYAQWQNQPIQLSKISLPWLLVAAVAYAGSMSTYSLFWHRVLWAMGQQPTWWESLRGYWIGNVGKYVPGKALVVILRASMVSSHRTDAAVAGLAVVVETLVMMAAGGFLAAVILLTGFHERHSLQLLSVGMIFAMGIPVVPPIFRWIVRSLQATRTHEALDAALDGVDWRLMGTGWCLQTTGWLLLGFSLWAIIRSIPGGEQCDLWALPLTIASACLAVVAGFISLLPGGLGVREWVLNQLLAPQFGLPLAALAVILLRIISLMCELLIGATAYVARRWSSKTSSV